MPKWIKYKTDDERICLEEFRGFQIGKDCHINGRQILKEDFEIWEPKIIQFVSGSSTIFLDLVNLSMTKLLNLTNEEDLILKQTIIRYLKLTEYKLDSDVLNNILKKLGVITPKTLIKDAIERRDKKRRDKNDNMSKM